MNLKFSIIMIPADAGEFITRLAREVVEKTAWNEDAEKPGDYPALLNEKRGVFCTIYKVRNGRKELRGCIGFPYPSKPMIDAIMEAAQSACFDQRFPPLKADELKRITVEVSVLTKPVETPADEIREGIDGVIIKEGRASALYLPQVWDYFENKEQFLSNLCIKAGLQPDAWQREGMKFYAFKAEVFEE